MDTENLQSELEEKKIDKHPNSKSVDVTKLDDKLENYQCLLYLWH